MPEEPDGACVVLHTPDRMILLHKRDTNAPTKVGYWSLFGGEVEEKDGGNPRRTASRELAEELEGPSVPPQSLDPLCCVRVRRAHGSPTVHYFAAELTCDLSELRLKDEGDGLALFSEDQLESLPLWAEDRLAIARYLHGPKFGYISCDH